MSNSIRDGAGLLERIKVKGRDFDQDGVETPKEVLLRMPGLFKLKDVEGRIPIEPKRLKYWYSNPDGPYRKCFTKIPMGETRSLVFVDLELLCSEFLEQYNKSSNASIDRHGPGGAFSGGMATE
jgi:hypothetical protein